MNLLRKVLLGLMLALLACAVASSCAAWAMDDQRLYLGNAVFGIATFVVFVFWAFVAMQCAADDVRQGWSEVARLLGATADLNGKRSFLQRFQQAFPDRYRIMSMGTVVMGREADLDYYLFEATWHGGESGTSKMMLFVPDLGSPAAHIRVAARLPWSRLLSTGNDVEVGFQGSREEDGFARAFVVTCSPGAEAAARDLVNRHLLLRVDALRGWTLEWNEGSLFAEAPSQPAWRFIATNAKDRVREWAMEAKDTALPVAIGIIDRLRAQSDG